MTWQLANNICLIIALIIGAFGLVCGIAGLITKRPS